MSVAEFRAWEQYDREHGLPARRNELYLAQIAHTVALCSGRFDAPPKLRDFLITEPEDEVNDLDELKAHLGFNPRN